MKNLKRVVLVIMLCVLVVLYFTVVWPIQKLFWSFDHLERNAKQVITAAQLQTWATGLLANAPTNTTLKIKDLGTNFPAQLVGLFRRPPDIAIHQADANQLSCVFLVWGGGLIGNCGFEIGQTNFVSHRPNARAWQPGVYFWSEYPQK